MKNLFEDNISKLGTFLILGTFMYFGIHSVLNPETFSAIVPTFISNIINPTLLVTLHGMVEIACSLMIFFKLGGRWPWYVLTIAFIGALISVSGLTLIRDIAILGGLLTIYRQYQN